MTDSEGGFDAGNLAEPGHEPAGEAGFLDDVTQLYLNEIGATPLLKPAQELALSRAACASASRGMAWACVRCFNRLPISPM